jgi:hypothetical protein
MLAGGCRDRAEGRGTERHVNDMAEEPGTLRGMQGWGRRRGGVRGPGVLSGEPGGGVRGLGDAWSPPRTAGFCQALRVLWHLVPAILRGRDGGRG